MLRRRKLLFAVNAHAGKAAIRTPFLEILDTFVRSGYEPTVYLSQRAGELPEIVREEAGSYDLVVCSGGDGTLNETVNGLMQLESRPALGYIPAGTTNDFATSLCIPKKMDKAAIAAVSGVPVWVDVGRFGQEYFAYVAAFGAFTDVAYTTPQDMKNSLGRLAYVLACAQRLTSLPSYHIRLEHDGGVVVVANAQRGAAFVTDALYLGGIALDVVGGVAFGAGDADFALALGDGQHLSAVGALEVRRGLAALPHLLGRSLGALKVFLAGAGCA